MSEINNISPNLKTKIPLMDDIELKLKQSLAEAGTAVSSSVEFASLITDAERVLFSLRLLEKYEMLNFNVKKLLKDEIKATAFRKYGNELYTKKRFKDALMYYNKSIAHGPKNSETLALAYGNRSAVLYTVKKYDASIRNIALALKENYPNDLRNKLHDRQRKCEQILNNKQNIINSYDPELSYGPNTEIPCASSAVSLKYNVKYGRHVVAARDIKCGDVLAIEPPFCSLLSISNGHTHCSYCLQKSLTLIPCVNCCNALFCDEKCLQDASDAFHSTECAIFATLLSMEMTKIQILSLRVAIVAFNKHENELKRIHELESSDDPRTVGFTKQNGGQSIYDSKSYAPIHMLITNYNNRTLSDKFYRAMVAATMLHLVQTFSNIQENLTMFGALIYKHLMTSACNMHTISNLNDTNLTTDDQLGYGAFAFHSLLNHACTSNVNRQSVFVDGQLRMVSIAVAPIAKGGEILDNYGFHHSLTTKTERQKELLFQYLFNCECPACDKDFPLFNDLPLLSDVPANIVSDKDIQMLGAANVKYAVQALPRFLKMLENLNGRKPYPNRQFCSLQEAVKQCYSVIYYKPYF